MSPYFPQKTPKSNPENGTLLVRLGFRTEYAILAARTGRQIKMDYLDKLSPESVIFELRYDNSYLLWDNTGSIWSRMVLANPRLVFSNVHPNQQVFETPNLQLSLELGQLKIVGRGDDAFQEVASSAARFLD